jgi:hypothetical protein
MLDGIYQMDSDFLEVHWWLAVNAEVREGIILGKLFKLEHCGFCPFQIAIPRIKFYVVCIVVEYLEPILILGGSSKGSQLGLVGHAKHLLLFLGDAFESLPARLKEQVVVSRIDSAGDGVIGCDYSKLFGGYWTILPFNHNVEGGSLPVGMAGGERTFMGCNATEFPNV